MSEHGAILSGLFFAVVILAAFNMVCDLVLHNWRALLAHASDLAFALIASDWARLRIR